MTFEVYQDFYCRSECFFVSQKRMLILSVSGVPVLALRLNLFTFYLEEFNPG